MSRVYDDVRPAGAYAQGNGLPERSLRAWVELISSHIRGPSPSIVEIGRRTLPG